jgi:hypothetical protein
MQRDRNSGLQTHHIKTQNALYDSVAGLIFLGTPHAGSGVTTKLRVKILERLARATFKSAPEKLIKALEANSHELLELSDNFEKTTIFTKHQIDMCTYYETRTTALLGEEVMCFAALPEALKIAHCRRLFLRHSLSCITRTNGGKVSLLIIKIWSSTRMRQIGIMSRL